MSGEAEQLIAQLGLKPHPEGGHFRETFRDADSASQRARSTAIYFLLKAQEESRWHRIDAAELWHWYRGAPLALRIAENGVVKTLVLGNDIANGQAPQIVVPPNAWQSARSLGAYTLVGCTVAPGFQFEHFELAPEGFTP
ncbi:MAG TPA: cupin domain-containing protein [Rhizomicrobium sp.]|nr:cupin domain-containing protein [Rhizomicrobium sp.]